MRASGLLSLKALGKAGDATANQFLCHAVREQRYVLGVGLVGAEAMLRLFTEQEANDKAFTALTRFLDALDEGGEEIATAVAGVVAANGTAPDPQAYGWSVARQLYPDVLSYRVGTAANFWAGNVGSDTGGSVISPSNAKWTTTAR